MAYSSRFEQRNHVILHKSGTYALYGRRMVWTSKQRYRSPEYDTVQHLEAIVQASAQCNSTQLFDWEWREWDTFLSPRFKPLPGISRMQHFCISQDSPGIAMTHTSVDSSESPFQLLKKGIKATSLSADDLPLVLRPEGLSKHRVQYKKRRSNHLFDPSFNKSCSLL